MNNCKRVMDILNKDDINGLSNLEQPQWTESIDGNILSARRQS